MNARALTEQLGGKWKGSRGWAHCPSHREKTPSLTIMDGRERVLVKCFGGCSQEAVLEALKKVGIEINGPATRRCVHVPVKAAPEPPPLDCEPMLRSWESRTTAAQLEALARKLGVSIESLRILRASWADSFGAWAFPMRDGNGTVIGIRLRRTEDSKKWAVTGSRSGLIYSPVLKEHETVYICEGPTDTAAALTLGLCAIGRPSCNGCEDMILRYLQRAKARRAVIVSDNDAPGKRGADTLQEKLRIPSVMWIPPTKDIRAFLQEGGTAELIRSIITGMVWRYPK